MRKWKRSQSQCINGRARVKSRVDWIFSQGVSVHFNSGFDVVDVKGFEQLRELQTFSKQFPSDLNALDQVLSWFGELHPSSIETKVWLQCKLALAEGYTNAVKYAHKDLPPSVSIEVEVILGQSPQRLEIRVWDSGGPFDFERRLRTPSSLPNDQAEGGRGLAIMQKIADKLSYTRMDDNRNCLTIVKFY